MTDKKPASVTKDSRVKSDKATPKSVTKRPRVKSDTKSSSGRAARGSTSTPEQVKKGASKAKKPVAPAPEVAPAEVVAAAPAPKRRKKAAPSLPAAPAEPAAVPSGQRVGYVRVSSADQNTARQLDGVQVDRVFTDRQSGKNASRPQLTALLAHVREGDTVVVHSLDRLARNLIDLRALVDDLIGRGVRVEFLKESLMFAPGATSHMSALLLGVLGAFAEFERSLILERQKEGIEQARAAGRFKGRAPSLSPAQAAELVGRAAAGEQKAALAAEFGITRKAVYDYIARAGGGAQE